MLIVVESGTGGIQLHLIKNQCLESISGNFLLGALFYNSILHKRQGFRFSVSFSCLPPSTKLLVSI